MTAAANVTKSKAEKSSMAGFMPELPKFDASVLHLLIGMHTHAETLLRHGAP